MDLNWLQSILYGFVSGLMDILPVSAQAHRVLLLKFFGAKGSSNLMYFLIHLGVFGALYYQNHAQMIRMSKARALARVPKKRRKRPLDTRSLMDSSLARTMLIPAILGLLLYRHTADLGSNLLLLSLFILLNGIILYIPQYMPTSNRDSRSLSRVEGLLMGLGGAVSVVPGFSAMGAATSVASVCGVDAAFGLNMVLIMNMLLNLGYMVYDVLGMFSNGLGLVSFAMFLRYLLMGGAAFGGTMLGIRAMRHFSANSGYGIFAFYCLGLSMFTFVLNLMA